MVLGGVFLVWSGDENAHKDALFTTPQAALKELDFYPPTTILIITEW